MATNAIGDLITTLAGKDSRTRKRARDQLVEIGQGETTLNATCLLFSFLQETISYESQTVR